MKRIFKFSKFIFCVYHKMLGEFKNFIQIIKTWVTDKIVSYSIYALIILLVGKQFIKLNSFSDIECILANFRRIYFL